MRQSEFGFDHGDAAEAIVDGAFLLRGRALPVVDELLVGVQDVVEASPLRHMITPGGAPMAAAQSNCGALGWVADRRGYRYEACDPETGRPWPAMPQVFASLARDAAGECGYDGFDPDCCLLNRYEVGCGMGQHVDADEQDFAWPIVSVSLGLPMTFRFGGVERGGKTLPVVLQHGDVLVFGGAARRRYHGTSPLKRGVHPVLGACRVNLTLRRAGTGALPRD
ncbi:MAG: DNA oxidative demethylase AlkB [Planctomycetes bacterium]|nr:DNA oxidative demethylase AlkB [Planctomycetota bacterium]